MTSALPLQQFSREDCELLTAMEQSHDIHVAELVSKDEQIATLTETIHLMSGDAPARMTAVYEQARHDADARLDLCEHIVAELWRHSEDISVRDGEGTDLTLDTLIDTDLPRAFAETAWAMAQVLKSPSCLVTTWLRSIDWCMACARDGHRCDVAPCGCHHDPFGCSECAEIMASAAADRQRDEERGR